MPSSQTNITFSNDITESDSINILTYEYLYNGGGVGILDVNNDGLKDIFFTGNQVANALYLNKGKFQFEDISESAGITMTSDWSTGVSIIDINADGYDDIYVSVGGRGNKSIFPNKLFINQKNATFKESAVEYGLADPGESIQAAFFDYDKDGDLDVYLLTGGGFEKSAIVARPVLEKGENRNTDRLYQNNYDSTLAHPLFTNVSASAGILIEGFGLGVSILDANQDTWPDVYVSNDYLSRDLLYINNQNGTFTDRSLDYFKHTSHFSMGNDVGDINNDGLPDIITVDMLPENHRRRQLMFGPNDHDRFYMAVDKNYGYQYMRNMLHVNHGNEGFSEVGQLAGVHRTDWSWAPLLADFDNDGLQDLYITNGFGKDVTDLDFVKFRKDVASPYADKGKLEKLLIDSLENRPSVSLPDYIYTNQGGLSFKDQSKELAITQSSISNGAAYADLDLDGDLDLVVNNLNEKAFVYQNTLVEKDSLSANFLKVELKGPSLNPSGLGAKVSIYADGKYQVRFQQVVRGFLSSSDKTIHFGLGAAKKVDSVIVEWPDGKTSFVGNVSINATMKISWTDAKMHQKTNHPKPYFTPTDAIDYQHKENQFNDFLSQPLRIQGLSRQGPGMAVGDVNGDGLEDLFVGGAYQSPSSLFIQNRQGKFEERTLPSEKFEDTGCILFDADNDKDLDLYVASGGTERYAGHVGYQDRLYVNDGKGNFVQDVNALPPMFTSTSVVVAGDFDQDEDLDLFVGGRVSPNAYPITPQSYVLENQRGKFVDITQSINPGLKNIGMVTAAVWTDFNNDSKLDLVVTGESMRITVLKNENGTLTDITDSTSLKDSFGLWNSLHAADFDNDGDMDFVAGNLGLNTPFKASKEQPLELHYGDFDSNGSVDPILSAYEEGVAYPLASLDQLTKQLPTVKKQMLHYRNYARANTKDILKLTNGVPYQTLQCNTLATSFIENLGDGHFSISALPREVQLAPVNGIISEDINADGKLDLIVVGNAYEYEVVNGRYDASIGSVLLNAGNNIFTPIRSSLSGFVAKGDTRGIVRLERRNNESLLFVAQNNNRLQSYSVEKARNVNRIQPKANERSALVVFVNRSRRKVELSAGGSYLSQSSSCLLITGDVKAVQFFNASGELTREISQAKKDQ